MKITFKHILFLLPSLWLCSSCRNDTTIFSGNSRLYVNSDMQMRIELTDCPEQMVNDYCTTEWIKTEEQFIDQYALTDQQSESVQHACGNGTQYTFRGTAKPPHRKVEKIVRVTVYDSFPGLFITQVSYINKGERNLEISRWKNNAFTVKSAGNTPAFWSFQGESTIARKDWILPVDSSFFQKNFMGMNNSDYGGGIPVTCLWHKGMGIAVGHMELKPETVSLPVKKSEYEDLASVGVEKEYPTGLLLKSGDTLQTLHTFVQVYTGDCFYPLKQFSLFMQHQGLKMPEPEPAAFEPMWCAWGYERECTFEEILGTLPKVKELGIQWATVDDGYQIAEGDWELDPKRFPGGDRDMLSLIRKMKSYDLKLQLWWAPLAADPGTKILKEHPDFITLSENSTPHYITWWDSYYLSPVYQPVVDYSKTLVERFIEKYTFDGLKLDGQHLNCVHADFHSGHHPETPELSGQKLPTFFKMIYDRARELNPHAVIQLCPCGCCMSFYNLPYTNQTVSSDPLNSRQIRSKGYVYKALVPGTAYFGDHVELSDNGNDFASSIGIGAVPGTKFTWPKNNPNVKENYLLTPEKEIVWKKWLNLYKEKMLSTGKYLGGLYDIGYTTPETHVIRKNEVLYYAFYAKNWDGELTLKGLDNRKKYTIYDYENGKELTIIDGQQPVFKYRFDNHLLIQANEIK